MPVARPGARAMQAAGLELTELRATGGFARNRSGASTWRTSWHGHRVPPSPQGFGGRRRPARHVVLGHLRSVNERALGQGGRPQDVDTAEFYPQVAPRVRRRHRSE
jgi:hypothetical protein